MEEQKLFRAAKAGALSRRELILRGGALGLSLSSLSALLAACGSDSEGGSARGGSAGTAGEMIELRLPPVLKSQPTEVIRLKKPKDGLKLGFVVPILTEPGETSMAAGTEKAAKVLGVDIDVVDANLDLSKQLELADQQLTQGLQGIITIALIPKTLDAFYKRADQQGVPNVTVFSDRPASIQESGGEPGKEAAKMILEKFPDGAKGVIFANTPAPVILERENGFKEAVGYKDKYGGADNPGSKIGILDFKRNLKETLDSARSIAADFIQRNPDLQFIWCTNDVNGQGAGLAAKAAGKDLMVFGMNGDPSAVKAIEAGLITATWDANQNRMGMRAVANCVRWVQDGKPPEIVKQDFTRITKENTADYIPWPQRAQ